MALRSAKAAFGQRSSLLGLYRALYGCISEAQCSSAASLGPFALEPSRLRNTDLAERQEGVLSDNPSTSGRDAIGHGIAHGMWKNTNVRQMLPCTSRWAYHAGLTLYFYAQVSRLVAALM
jgi:hypothetical protein